MGGAGLSTTSLVSIDEIDITLEVVDSGTGQLRDVQPGDPQAVECTSFPCTNRYRVNGTPLVTPLPWPPANRNVIAVSLPTDYGKLDIHYTYRFFAVAKPSVVVTQTKTFALEPQQI
jgi:hypothetical protein